VPGLPRFLRPALIAAACSVAVLVTSCKDSTGPTSGSLRIAVQGGPGGVPASITIVGPNGYSSTTTAPATLTGLAAGTYTITAADITTAVGRWTPTLVTQSVELRAGRTPVDVTLAYVLGTSRLTVSIEGLPAGVNGAVTVNGPGGFTRALTATTTIDALPPGTYTIVPGEVRSQYGYRAPQQTLTLAATTVPIVATVRYAAATGTLVVDARGLPDIAPAGSVTGPNGYNATFGAVRVLPFLEPGRYTVTASDVTLGSATYMPAPRTQPADVTAGAETDAIVTYAGPAPALDLRVVVQGLTNPVYLTAPANDERLFVVEQPGRIRVVKNGQLLATPFLDITSRVSYGGERGLLSMAFDPAYATNGWFYVYLTDPNGDIAVERYGSTPGADVASPTPTPVLHIAHPNYGNHNGGLVMFGPDGMLYLGTGDGGGGGDPSGNAQNLSSYLGKLLRIDVHAALPHTLTRADIWDYGLRNPWRFDVVSYPDVPDASDLYIADVGQNAYEEIDVAFSNGSGQNFDWNRMEGAHCYPSGATTCQPSNPFNLAYEYSHSDGCSITGGFLYLGTAIPWLRYSYLFSDYCGGWLRSLSGNYADGFAATAWPIPSIGNVLSFGKDSHGELYMLSANGSVYKIVPK
jgi:hypothetical protein